MQVLPRGVASLAVGGASGERLMDDSTPGTVHVSSVGVGGLGSDGWDLREVESAHADGEGWRIYVRVLAKHFQGY